MSVELCDLVKEHDAAVVAPEQPLLLDHIRGDAGFGAEELDVGQVSRNARQAQRLGRCLLPLVLVREHHGGGGQHRLADQLLADTGFAGDMHRELSNGRILVIGPGNEPKTGSPGRQPQT